ncbi:MAG: hypothetical protein ACKO9A_15035 [Alphaproteobacteria bacterium]
MRVITVPLSMLLLLLTLSGCVAGGQYYAPAYGYGGYGYVPYGGYAHRPYYNSYRAFEPARHHHHAGPLFPHRPIWKKW